MDYEKLLKDVINQTSLDLYLMATCDIKRSVDNIDAKVMYKIPILKEELETYPDYIIVEKTRNGYFEFLTQLPIGTIGIALNSAVYFEYSGDATIRKITSETDIKKCYDGNFNKEYLEDVASVFFDFYQTGLSAKNSIQNTDIKKNIKRYN